MSKIIFFVDDDKMILNLLEYTFQSRQDYQVITFQTGEECLKNLHQEPKLIVLDHILAGPGESRLNGLDTLIEITRASCISFVFIFIFSLILVFCVDFSK